MTNDEVRLIVENSPHMSRDQAERMTTFIADHGIRTLLELGFKHGVSTCFMLLRWCSQWFVDGLAFFLVHRLLKPGGWIIFDDLDWTHARRTLTSGAATPVRREVVVEEVVRVEKVVHVEKVHVGLGQS
jgi:hypothetical protein